MSNFDDLRKCDDCGTRMLKYHPRIQQGDGRMLCPACHKNPRGGLVSAQGSQARPGEDAVAFETGKQHVWHVTRHNGTTEPLCERHTNLASEHAEAQTGLAQDAGIPTDPRSTFSIGERHRGQCADCRREQPGLVRNLSEPNSSRMDTRPRSSDWPYSDQKRRTRKPFEPGFSTQNAKESSVRKEAHDPGDGVTIAHCPFCGSGQVIARSDAQIHCDFCNQNFTVQVQPDYSAFPQTVDGNPVQVPGVPGSGQQDPMADPMGVDPAATGASDGAPPFGDDEADGDGSDSDNPFASDDDSTEEETPDDDSGEGSDDSDSDDSKPPFPPKKTYRTATGVELEVDEYLRHLALKHTEDREGTLAVITTERGNHD